MDSDTMLDSDLLWASNLKPIGDQWIDSNPLYISQCPIKFPMWDTYP